MPPTYHPASRTHACVQVLFSHRPVVQRAGLPVSERCDVVQGETVIRLQIADYQLQAGEALYVTGGIPQLGNWQADQMLALIGAPPLRRRRLRSAAMDMACRAWTLGQTVCSVFAAKPHQQLGAVQCLLCAVSDNVSF